MRLLAILGSMVVYGCSAPPAVKSLPTPKEGARDAPLSALAPSSAEPSPARASERALARPFQLALLRDEAFLRAHLPALDVSRYQSFRESAHILVGKSHLSEVDLLPNGDILAMSAEEGAIRRYDRASKRLLGSVMAPGFEKFDRAAVVAWPSAEPRFLSGGRRGVWLYDADSDAFTPLDERPVRALRWSPDKQVLVSLGDGAREQTSVLHFFARVSEGLRSLGTLSFDERVDDWDLSRDNRLLALVHYPSDSVRVLDLASGDDLFRVASPRYAGAVAFSPDGRWLAVGGDGLLVIDLLNPDRRAFHSFVKNNIGFVRFSPSGDAIFASSYDGRIRIFDLTGGTRGIALRLLHELRHAGEANVYGFVFTSDGREVISVSGDRTIRIFSDRSAPHALSGEGMLRVFSDLAAWKRADPEGAKALPSPPSVAGDGPYAPPSFTLPARPSRIAPGLYACKITLIYKLRDCRVEKDAAGRTWLTFLPGHLLSLQGVLYDDGPVVRYEATLLEPSTLITCPGCARQPLFGIFRGTGKNYQGLLTFRNYHDPLVPPPEPPSDARIEEANDRFPLVLEWRGPLP